MDKPRPLCRYCGKPIPKRTKVVWFCRAEGESRLNQSWASYRTEMPASKAEVQRLLNEQVVSVRWSRGEDYYARDAGRDVIHQATTWDGESYVDKYFCNGEHARMFAYAAVKMDDNDGQVIAMPAYFEAIKKQKEGRQMVRNLLAEGSIGTMHGQMHELVRNPFRTKFMRQNYDAAVQTYDAEHRNFIYPSGRRCLGNAWANNFWRGFDGMERNWDADSKQSPAYAMWCAGRDIRATIDKKGSS